MKRRLRTLCAGFIALVALAACATSANSSGDGNEFSIFAKITAVGSSSVTIDHKSIEKSYTNGAASGWFNSAGNGAFDGDDYHYQIHDNFYDTDGNRHTVGTVYDLNYRLISLKRLHKDEEVRIVGSIRYTYDGNNTTTRAVFNEVDIVPK